MATTVTFFENPDGTGASFTLSPGSYNYVGGEWSDRIRSLRIDADEPDGVSVTLYKDADFLSDGAPMRGAQYKGAGVQAVTGWMDKQASSIEIDDRGTKVVKKDTAAEIQALARKDQPSSCPVLSDKQRQAVDFLRQRMEIGFREYLKLADAKGEADVKAAEKRLLQAEADARQSVSTGLTRAAAAVQSIPVAGQVIGAILAAAAALAKIVPLARGPQYQGGPLSEAVLSSGSYRGGFTPTAAQMNWPRQDRTRLWTPDEDADFFDAYYEAVDQKLWAYSQALGIDLRCVFPRYAVANAPSPLQVGQYQNLRRGKSYALLDDPQKVRPSLLLEALPDPGTPEFEAFKKAAQGLAPPAAPPPPQKDPDKDKDRIDRDRRRVRDRAGGFGIGELLTGLGLLAAVSSQTQAQGPAQTATYELVAVQGNQVVPLSTRGATFVLVGDPRQGTGLAGVPGAWPRVASGPPQSYGLPVGVVARDDAGQVQILSPAFLNQVLGPSWASRL